MTLQKKAEYFAKVIDPMTQAAASCLDCDILTIIHTEFLPEDNVGNYNIRCIYRDNLTGQRCEVFWWHEEYEVRAYVLDEP